MTSGPVLADTTAAEPARSFADRAFAAIPLACLAIAVFAFYAVEAWARKTPWIFTDEVEWTQISRAIEATGHASRRGEPIFFKTLYAVMIAPFWAIHSTQDAYTAIKLANVAMMTFAAVPTYFLARMLLPKRTSLVVALLAICIPGMAYVTSLVPEVLAYTWYAAGSLLVVRALARRKPLDFLWVAVISAGALLVRAPQFATLPASFLIAAGILWLTGPRGRAFRKSRSLADKIGLVVLLIGALILFNRIFLQQIEIWQLSTQYMKPRMLDLGLRAALAFTVGMGILPVIGGFASLRLVERRDDPAYRAFAAYFASSIFCISLYTAVKAAYLSSVFSTLTEERNLIYLAPLMLIGTALVLHSRKIDWRVAAAASAFVIYLIFEKPFQLDFPYFEAPGFAILTIPTRHWGWTIGSIQLLLVGLLVVSLLIVAFRRSPRILVAAAVLCASWMLTSEIRSTRGFNALADRVRANLPAQLDWIDRVTHGAPTTYLGQEIKDPNKLLVNEFWNRSIVHVYSMDGTAPGPGPTGTPDIVTPDGRLGRMPDTQYVVADVGVHLQALAVAEGNGLTLYRKQGPWRLVDASQQLYSDGWAPGWSTYTYFTPMERGTLEVTLSRTAYAGTAPAGHAIVYVGTVKIDPQRGAVLGKVYTRKRALVENGKLKILNIPVARTPVRVVITIEPTFRASVEDPRNLGAQVYVRFIPAKKQG